MALPALLVKIGADTKGLDTALGRAKRGFAGLAKAAAASGVLVAGALTAMAVQGLRTVDANVKLARSMDGTMNGLRAVQIAAGYAGVSLGEANTAMQSLNRELVSATEKGSPAFKALQKIGFAASDLANMDADERMAAIADRMQVLGISSGEASDILRDLGVRSRNMSLLLLQGGNAIRAAREEVRAFGLELTTTQTDGIESANDSIARMSLVFEGLRGRLAAEIAPALQGVADRFNEIAQSDSVQGAIERLADAFGRLSQIILSENFLTVAIRGMEGLANISASVAEGLVTLSQNLETVTWALSGMAIGAAALGGPFTLVVGLLAAALTGLALLRGGLDDAETAQYNAAAATAALRGELDAFYRTDAPSAGAAAVNLANDNYKLAASAYAVAKAEIAKAKAQISSVRSTVGMMGGSLTMEAEAQLSAIEAAKMRDIIKSEKDLAQAMRDRKVAANAVTGSDFSTITLPPVDITGGGMGGTGGGGGKGGGGAGGDSQTGLDALINGLQTEREILEEWRIESLELLNAANEKELEVLGGFNEAKLRLEEEYQDRLSKIKKTGEETNTSIVLGASEQVLSAIGQNNDKALKAAKIFGAAKALINTYEGASEALKLPFPGNLAAAASIISSGIGFVNAIKSGGSAGGAGTGAAAAGGAGAAPTARQVDINIAGGGEFIPRSAVLRLMEEINSASDENGVMIRVV
jgi:hypothetical protein